MLPSPGFPVRYNEKRVIHISTGTRDIEKAERQKKELEAKLLLGINSKPRKRSASGPHMAWVDFRERYSELQLSTIKVKSAVDAESRLDVAGRILKPRTLGDVADGEALHELQQKLLIGVERRGGKPRSPHTV